MTAARFRSRFILVCVMFGTVITFTGIANFYTQTVNEKLAQALRLHQDQYLISQNISEKFRFLLNNEGRISHRALTQVQRDLYSDISKMSESQATLEKFIARAARDYHVLWPDNLTLESVRLSQSESEFMDRMLRNLEPPDGYAAPEYIFFTRPLESNIVMQSTWRVRLAKAIDLVQLNNEYISRLNQLVLLSTFLGLLVILLVAYATLFAPMFQRLRRTSEISQLKIDTHESLANFLKDVSFIGYTLMKNPQSFSLLLSRKIDGYPVLRGTRIKLLERKLPVLDLPKHTFAETIHQTGGSASYLLLVSLPESLLQVEKDILPFVKALANHLSALFEVQLRMTAEQQRDMYYQVAEAAFRALPSPIAIFDENGKGLMANPAFSSLFKLSELQALTECSLARIESKHQDMQLAAAKHAGEVFVSGPAVEFNVSYEHSTLVWTRLPVHEVGYVFIGHDVTQILKHLSREEHYRSLDYLGQMAGSVAHDTNNFLAVIMNTLEIVEMSTELDDKLGELLQVAINTCQKASTMNSHLVSFTRKQNLAPDCVSPETLVNKVELFLANEQFDGVELVLEVDEQAQIFADPLYLENALINVVKNAVESMAGQGQLNMRIEQCNADLVCLQIGDTGPGFTEDDLKQALEPYYTRKVSGTGLGLAAVFGFANQSKGNVFLRNRHGVCEQGAIVEIQLPRFQVNLKDRGSDGLLPDESEPDSKRSLEIFLLEDNEALSEIIVAQLHGAGHHVRSASSLKSAQKMLKECTSIDVMVSDIILPDGRGFSVIRNIRRRFPDVRLIYTTGYGTESFTDEFKKFPGLVLQKPFRISRLIQHVNNYSGSSKSAV